MKLSNIHFPHITLRFLIIFICTTIFLHFLLTANESYYIFSNNDNNETHASGLTYWQYKDYIKALDKDVRIEAITNSRMFFFNILPSWTINIIYLSYFAWVLLLVKYNLPRHKIPGKKKHVDPIFDFEEEPMSKQEKLLLASMSDRQLEEHNRRISKRLEETLKRIKSKY